MTTRKSARKKANQFEDLADTVSNPPAPDFVDPSSITDDSDTKLTEPDSDLKTSFTDFKKTTTDQICQIEISFHRMNNSMKDIHEATEKLVSRQN